MSYALALLSPLSWRPAADGISPAPSPSAVRRWLADDAIKPWQHRSWIFPRDLRFAVKASRVLDLYQREWEGEPLGEDEYVLSADEKPGVQARMRIHLPLPAGPGRPGGRARPLAKRAVPPRGAPLTPPCGDHA